MCTICEEFAPLSQKRCGWPCVLPEPESTEPEPIETKKPEQEIIDKAKPEMPCPLTPSMSPCFYESPEWTPRYYGADCPSPKLIPSNPQASKRWLDDDNFSLTTPVCKRQRSKEIYRLIEILEKHNICSVCGERNNCNCR